VPYYIVYRGRQRYRDGSERPRVRVKKLRGKGIKNPRIVSKHYEAGDLWVTIEYTKRVRTRGGHYVERKFKRDVHLGKGSRESVRLTTRPPKGPKIDRRKKRGKRKR